MILLFVGFFWPLFDAFSIGIMTKVLQSASLTTCVHCYRVLQLLLTAAILRAGAVCALFFFFDGAVCALLMLLYMLICIMLLLYLVLAVL